MLDYVYRGNRVPATDRMQGMRNISVPQCELLAALAAECRSDDLAWLQGLESATVSVAGRRERESWTTPLGTLPVPPIDSDRFPRNLFDNE